MTSTSMPGAPERKPVDDFERRHGRFGERELRAFPFELGDLRDSGAGAGQFTIVGHAAVFNMWSLDLGGFRERILPGFFDEVLSADPDVFHLIDHDTSKVLSRTRSKTLELGLDKRGLRMWSRVAPTSYGADLRVSMDRGDIDQASFAFEVAKDEWRIKDDGNGNETIERDLITCAGLYDVTTCAMGAYPQTDSQVARQRALDYARTTGRLPGGAVPSIAPEEPVGASEPRHQADSAVQFDLRRRALGLDASRTPRL